MKRALIILFLTATAFGINKRYLRPQANTVGLIAHYKLWDGLMTTGKVFDYSLNGHGGTLNDTDTPITLIPTYPGFDFDGSDDYIEIADHDDFTPAGTPLSVSIWINPDDVTSFPIASKGDLGTDGEWLFYVHATDVLRFLAIDDSVPDAYIGREYSVALTSYENTWIHLVATYDGGTLASGIKLYLEAIRVDDTNRSAFAFVAIENLTGVVKIGKERAGYANGLIDDMMIFNKVLSAVEVKNIYEVTRWRYQR